MEYKTTKIIIEDFGDLGKKGITQKEKEFIKGISKILKSKSKGFGESFRKIAVYSLQISDLKEIQINPRKNKSCKITVAFEIPDINSMARIEIRNRTTELATEIIKALVNASDIDAVGYIQLAKHCLEFADIMELVEREATNGKNKNK